MTIDRRALAGALATLVLVAACGGSATQSPGATSSASATPAAGSAAPTESPAAAESSAPTSGPAMSLAPGAASDLEAMLPSEVNGVTFTKSSFDGSTIPGGIPIGSGSGTFEKLLTDNGKTLQDVRIAIATATGATAGGTTVMAIQVKGVPSDKLLALVSSDASSAQKTTVGGKEVYGAATGGIGAYFYVKDDIIFYVLSMGTSGLADAVVAQLP